MKTIILAALLAASAFATPNCGTFSGNTLAQIQTEITASTPCVLDGSMLLYGPWTLVSSVMPVSGTHPNIGPADITIQFNVSFTSPYHTDAVIVNCPACATTGQQASQIEIGFYASGTFSNFGVLLAQHTFTRQPILPASHEYAMPVALLDGQLGAAGAPGYQVQAVADYLFTSVAPYVPTSVTTGVIPVTMDLTQVGFAAVAGVSYQAWVYLSQPGS